MPDAFRPTDRQCSVLSSFKRGTTALTVVLTGYLAYALLAVPLIEPDITLPTPTNVIPIPPEEKRAVDFSHLFADDAWERDEKRIKEFDTDYGTLLFQQLIRMDDGRVELRPFTAVLNTVQSTGNNEGRPIVLQAPGGAELKFDQPVRSHLTKVGRLVGGRLLGEIRIFSPPSAPGADDRLDVVTRNIQLSGSRIFTPHDVQFKFGPHWGSGRNLTIESVPATRPARSNAQPAIGGIKSMELVHVDKVHLQPSKSAKLKSNLPSDDQPTVEAQSKNRAPPAPLEVTCRGPFLFDFEKSIGSFEDNVDVLRIRPDGPIDQLNSRLLEVYFREKPSTAEKKDQAEKVPTTNKTGAMPRLEIKHIVAVGHPVTIHSTYEMEAERVEYELGPEGEIGTLWAAGPGRIYTDPQESKRPFSAHWKQELVIQPDGDKHVVSLLGGASVRFGEDSEFSAGELHLWVMEMPKFLAPAKDQSDELDFAPDQLLARHNVRIRSPRLTARTGQLEAWFINQPAQSEPSHRTDGSTSDQTGHAIVRPISLQRRKDLPKDPPKQSFDAVGDSIRLQLAQIGDKTEVRVINVFDNVRVVETRTKKPDEVPLVMEGNLLLVGRQADERSIVEIAGKPAKVSARGMSLVGEKINLDQVENKLTIDGPGRMTLKAKPRSNSGARKTVSESVVTWTGHMRFDGETAHFEEEIEARSVHALKELQTLQSVVTSGSLDATLSDHVDFSATDEADGIELKTLTFHEGAQGHAQTFDQRQKLLAVSHMQSYRLMFDQQKEFFTADGPGWLTDVRLAKSPLKRRRPATASNPNTRSHAKTQLFFSRIEFQRGAQGDLEKSEFHFVGRVRGIYGPVRDWNEQLALQGSRPVVEDTFVLHCDHLVAARVGAPVNGDDMYDYLAQGNAFIQSMEFDAQGDRLSYSQSKDLAVLEGNPREDAKLRRYPRTGQTQQQQAAARRIFYSPGRDEVRVDDVRQIELSQ